MVSDIEHMEQMQAAASAFERLALGVYEEMNGLKKYLKAKEKEAAYDPSLSDFERGERHGEYFLCSDLIASIDLIVGRLADRMEGIEPPEPPAPPSTDYIKDGNAKAQESRANHPEGINL